MTGSVQLPPPSGRREWLLVLLAAVATSLLYLPALHAPYIFDDYQNLRTLALIDAGEGLNGLLGYSFSGISSAIGRPLSLFSFALQHESWPGDPAAFRLVGLAIHLLNGLLLYLFCKGLVRLGLARFWVAPLVALIWLIHPIQTTTVVYIVQRMVELAALFTLIGLLLYLKGRQAMVDGGRYGLVWMSGGVAVGVGLGVMAKETAALLPLYILVLEATLLARLKRDRWWWHWAAVMLIAPVLLLVGYHLFHFETKVLAGYLLREFTLGERLLTEARVLVDYLGRLLLPGSSLYTVFHDGYPVSRSLLDPPQTLLAVVGWSGALLVAITNLRRWPLFAFALLWYLAGHLLESTLFALELMIDHRNYLPIFGPLYALVVVAGRLAGLAGDGVRRLLAAAAVVVVLLLAAITHAESRLWGSPLQQAARWALAMPESQRAQSRLGEMLEMAGEIEASASQFLAIADGNSDDGASLLMVLALHCRYLERVAAPDEEEMVRRASRSRRLLAGPAVLDQIVNEQWLGGCPGVEMATVHRLIEAFIDNPAYAADMDKLYLLRSRSHINQRIFDLAVADADNAYRITGRIDILFQQIELMFMAGVEEGARHYLELAIEAAATRSMGERLYGKQVRQWCSKLERPDCP